MGLILHTNVFIVFISFISLSKFESKLKNLSFNFSSIAFFNISIKSSSSIWAKDCLKLSLLNSLLFSMLSF